MKCPVCIETGKTSKVYIGVGIATAMYSPPFYDEDGILHHHDPNTTTSEYTCSEGHRFSVTSGGKCWCGWGPGEISTEILETMETEIIGAE